MKLIEAFEMLFRFDRVTFRATFIGWPSREQLKTVFGRQWQNWSKQAQDATFDMLIFPESFPTIPFKGHWSNLVGCVNVVPFQIFECQDAPVHGG